MLCKKGASDILAYMCGEGWNYGSYITRYLLLSSTPINADGTGATEPESPSYKRCKIGDNNSSGVGSVNYFSEVKETSGDLGVTEYYVDNVEEIHFKEARDSWGELRYYAVSDSDAKGRGNILYAGELGAPISPVINTVPLIRPGQIKIAIKVDKKQA